MTSALPATPSPYSEAMLATSPTGRGNRVETERLVGAERSPVLTLLLLLDSLVSVLVLPKIGTVRSILRNWLDVPVPAEPLSGAPLVSVIVPARNEALAIESCIRSVLDQSYPSFEVLVLDDRSEDATGDILAALADHDERLRVLAGEPLPAGWVGKCWALYQAARQARGEWLLFLDADTHLRPGAILSVVAFAQERQLDLLTLVPQQTFETFWELAILPAIFGAIMTSGGSFHEVNDPNSPVAKAIGQFMFFRASSYWSIGGHETVRDEIVEDFALARRIKGTGLRLTLADGRRQAQTRMYRSLGQIWQGFSKNSYLEARKQPGGIVAVVLTPWLTIAFPLLTSLCLAWRRLAGRTACRQERLLQVQSGLQLAAVLHFSYQIVQMLGIRIRWALSVPFGFLFFSVLLLNSAYRVLSGRGVSWRGRTYQARSEERERGRTAKRQARSYE